MARVLIAGCGYVGTALGERLVADSHQVWGLRRRTTLMPPGIEPLVADLTSQQSLKQLPSALDFVFYMASPGGLDEPYYRSAFVDGLRGLLEALEDQRQRPRRLFFISSTAVYAQERGEWVDESSPTEPRHFGGRRLLEAEELLLESPLPATVVRFAGIYGPRRAGLVDRVRSGRAVYRPRPSQWTNRIHRDDCAGVLQHLMQLPKPESLYLGVDCEPATEQTVMEWLSGALGAPPPRPAGKEDAPARNARGNKRCRNQLLLASGYGFRHPSFREGYRAILEELI